MRERRPPNFSGPGRDSRLGRPLKANDTRQTTRRGVPAWRKASWFFGVLFAASLALPAPAAESRSVPNIVIIHADDLGWSDPGCQGNEYIDTPAIDQLAREGLRFTQAYAAAPVCTPARAGLITGQYPGRLDVTGQPGYRNDQRNRKLWHPPFRTDLDPGTPTIGSVLARAGYVTACVGKYGLDEPATRDGFAVEFSSADDGALTDRAIEFLQQHRDGKFLLYFNPHSVHIPLRPDPDLVEKYQHKPKPDGLRVNPEYAAEVETLDRLVARIVGEIDRLNLRENSIVIFTSDNGAFLGMDETFIATNVPLHEGKASLYEGGLRVPLIVRWPGNIKPGTNSNTPVHGVDWLPTVAALAGVSLPATTPFDGVNLTPLLLGRNLAPRLLFWHYPHYRRSMAGLTASPSSAVRDGDWKLIHFYEDDHVELYDLREDAGEAHDLASARPDRAAALRHELDAWRSDVGAQPPVPNSR